MKYEFSDKEQQYQYFLEVNDVRESKHLIFSVKFQGAKFPDDVQSKVEFFLNPGELGRLIEFLSQKNNKDLPF